MNYSSGMNAPQKAVLHINAQITPVLKVLLNRQVVADRCCKYQCGQVLLWLCPNPGIPNEIQQPRKFRALLTPGHWLPRLATATACCRHPVHQGAGTVGFPVDEVVAIRVGHGRAVGLAQATVFPFAVAICQKVRGVVQLLGQTKEIGRLII